MSKQIAIPGDGKALALGDNVVIPNDIFIRCPMKNWKLRQAKMCDSCEYCHGLTAKLTNPELPFNSQFKMQCAYPCNRELFVLEIEME